MPMTEYLGSLLFDLIDTGEVALYSTAPDAAAPGGVEIDGTGNGYDRKPVVLVQDLANVAAGSSDSNITWTNMPECDVVAVGYFDTASGELLAYQTLPTPKHFEAGDDASFPAGQLTFSFS